jgi:type I site-specific restriction endonuclease
MPKPEAFSRVLIDQALKDSGWDLLDDHRVRFELDGKSCRADYVLSGERGPLCVLEAKRPDLDPYDAKEQARGYAENLRAPFVILSNGKEHWFWNYERAGQRDASLDLADNLSRSRREDFAHVEKSSTSFGPCSGGFSPVLSASQRSLSASPASWFF